EAVYFEDESFTTSCRRIPNERWNDTYLMWELLYKNGWPDENIHVLYGDGKDYEIRNPRYQAPFPDKDITDTSAYYHDVVDIFNALASGDPDAGIEPMGPKDNLFVWTHRPGWMAAALRIVDISDPTNPQEVGVVYLPRGSGSAYSATIKDNYYYVAMGQFGIWVYDISDPLNPERIGIIRIPGWVLNLFIMGNYLYATTWSGFAVVDISTPPGELVNYAYCSSSTFCIDGFEGWFGEPDGSKIEYLAVSHASYICYLNVASDPLQPSLIGRTERPFGPWQGVEAAGRYTFTTGFLYKTLYVDSLWEKAGEMGVESIASVSMGNVCFDMEKKEDYLLVGCGNGITVVDVSSPRDPQIITSLSLGNKSHHLLLERDLLFVANRKGGLRIIDVSDPQNPYEIGSYTPSDEREVSDVDLYRNYAFVLTRPWNLTQVDEISYLEIKDDLIRDDVFANMINEITCHRRVFWFQHDFSGGFVDNLEDGKTVILTACDYNEFAHIADDKRSDGSSYIENEEWQPGDICYHGEFNFHVMNAVRQTEIWPYDDPPPVPSDLDGNRHTSMWEAFQWVKENDSRPETPQYSDPGNIGPSTYLVWDDFKPPAPPVVEGYYFTPVEILSQPEEEAVGCVIRFIPNTEPDFSGYRMYKDGELFIDTHADSVVFPIPEFVPGTTYVYTISGYDVYGYESEPKEFVIRLPLYIAEKENYDERLCMDYDHLFSYDDAYSLVFQSDVHTPYGHSSYLSYLESQTGNSWRRHEILSMGHHPSLAFSAVSPFIPPIQPVEIPPYGVYTWNVAFLVRPSGSSYLYLKGLYSTNYREPTATGWDTVTLASCDVSQAVNGYPSFKYPTIYTQGMYVHLVFEDIFPGAERLRYRKYYRDWSPVGDFEDIPIICDKPSLTVDMSGIPHVAVVHNDKLYYSYRSSLGWTEGVEIYDHAEDVYLSTVGDKIYAVWTYGNDVYWMEGSLSNPDPLTRWKGVRKISRTRPVKNPKMVQGMYIVWEEGGEIVLADTTAEIIFSTVSPTLKKTPHVVWPGNDSLYLVWIEEGKYIYIKPEKVKIPVVPALYSISVGESEPSPFTLARDGYIEYASGVRVDYGNDSLVYLLPSLLTNSGYTVELVFYHESSGEWKEKIKLDGRKARVVKVKAGVPETVRVEIPYPYYKDDGEVRLSITRKKGDYVSIASLKVYKSRKKGPSVGGPQFSTSGGLAEIFDVRARSVTSSLVLEILYQGDCKIEVFDVAGRRRSVISEAIDGRKDIKIELPSGAYIWRVRTADGERKGKVIILR
ncbi:hypothetical protein DRQ20_00165, partial [bacterium]